MEDNCKQQENTFKDFGNTPSYCLTHPNNRMYKEHRDKGNKLS